MTTVQKPVTKVALAYSGGLDSTVCIKLLEREYGAQEVILVMVDVGQGEESLAEARERVAHLPLELFLVDARRDFTDTWIPKAIAANGSYGGYPLSSSMTRQLIAAKVAEVAREQGCDAVAEGSTGKGNDQFRFHNTFTLLAPELRVVTPIRDLNLSRVRERLLAQEFGLTFKEGISDDRTCWGRSIGSGEIEDLQRQVDPDEYIWWHPIGATPAAAQRITVEFDEGRPVRVDGVRGMDAMIGLLNEAAGRHSIGRIDVLEDGIMGLKSREVYEAPAASVLLAAHRDLERLCLTKRELAFKAGVDATWAELVYHGHWHHPLKHQLDAFIAESQRCVTGEITLDLHAGNAIVAGRRSEQSLFDPAVRSIEQDSFDQSGMSAVVETYAFENVFLGGRSRRQAVIQAPEI
ncbi:argininosuccinate synthase [Dactylosporangium sp. CS-047395]|uniref:argininosuccinate synthase n=1 Tax=Dactylosporangium sp. CS-047395 TaxID=3239936 RepID=UPI003D909F42